MLTSDTTGNMWSCRRPDLERRTDVPPKGGGSSLIVRSMAAHYIDHMINRLEIPGARA